MPGLPYEKSINEEDEAETLEITVKDKYKDIKVVISLSIFEKYDCVIRNTTIKNDTDTVFNLERAMSITHDFDRTDFDLIHFPGIYALERQFRRESLSEGDKVMQSNTWRSSHEHNPFVMLADKDANETYGDVYAFSIMYSGSFKCNEIGRAHV